MTDLSGIQEWVQWLDANKNQAHFPFNWFWQEDDLRPQGAASWSRSKVYTAREGMGIETGKVGKTATITIPDAVQLVICLAKFNGNAAEWRSNGGGEELALAKKPQGKGLAKATTSAISAEERLPNLTAWKETATLLAWFADEGLPISTTEIAEAFRYSSNDTITGLGESFTLLGFAFSKSGESFKGKNTYYVERVQKRPGQTELRALSPAASSAPTEEVTNIGFVRSMTFNFQQPVLPQLPSC